MEIMEYIKGLLLRLHVLELRWCNDCSLDSVEVEVYMLCEFESILELNVLIEATWREIFTPLPIA